MHTPARDGAHAAFQLHTREREGERDGGEGEREGERDERRSWSLSATPTLASPVMSPNGDIARGPRAGI
jgi:hypothetical protein